MAKSEEPPEVIHSRPTDELQSIWQWNYTKKETQSVFGEEVFVPRIMFMQIDGSILSVVVWTDAIPTLLPRVDALVIFRQDLAPRRLFKRQDDTCVVPFDSALPVLESFKSNDYNMPAFALCYATAPRNVTAFVKNLKPHTGQMEGVAIDQILNQELVEKFRN